MATINFTIFNLCKFAAFGRIVNGSGGGMPFSLAPLPPRPQTPAHVERGISGAGKLHIWATDNINNPTDPREDFELNFAPGVTHGGHQYGYGNFKIELKYDSSKKEFVLSCAQTTGQHDIVFTLSEK